jgi:hypothetical protein
VYDLGEGQTMTMIHCDVFFLSPSIIRQMMYQWKLFRKHVPQAVFAHSTDDDAKWERFVKRFGFVYLKDILCSDGKTRRLFINTN